MAKGGNRNLSRQILKNHLSSGKVFLPAYLWRYFWSLVPLSTCPAPNRFAGIGFLSLLEVFLGSLVPFRTHLVGLLFLSGEKYYYFLLVCAFSPALTCVFLALLYTNTTFQVEEPPAWEAGPSGGQRQVPHPGRAPAADRWRYFVWSLVPHWTTTCLEGNVGKEKERLPSTTRTFISLKEERKK